MSRHGSRFETKERSPTFAFEGFLLRNEQAATPGFDEWNIFAVPDSCLRHSQFNGRYLPGDRARTAEPLTSARTALARPPTADQKQSSPHSVLIDAPEAFHPPPVQRPATTAPPRQRPERAKPENSTLKPLVECVFEATPANSMTTLLKRSSLKGKMFSTNKCNEPAQNDSMLKSYDNEYDLHAFSQHSIPTDRGDDGSDVIPTLNKPLQVHDRMMGWKLTSPDRRMVPTAPNVRRARRVKPVPLTLKSMGYCDSTSDVGVGSTGDEQHRIHNRQLNALEKIFRRNTNHRNKEEIARKASRSVCRSQNLDVIVKPKGRTGHVPGATAVATTDQSSRESPTAKKSVSAPVLPRTSQGMTPISQRQEDLLLSQYGFGLLGKSVVPVIDEPASDCSEPRVRSDGDSIASLLLKAPDARIPDNIATSTSLHNFPVSDTKRTPGLVDTLGLCPPRGAEGVGTEDPPSEELYLRELRIRMKKKL